jgi:GntR family transcriptional regulator
VLGPVDPTSDRAVYRQIADQLRDAINNGELAPGERLPSERDLMETYSAARGTVRQAVAILRAEGLIETEHGRGGFVRRRPAVQRVAHDRFLRRHRAVGKAAYQVEMEAAGRTPEVEILELGRGTVAPPDVARRLELEPEAPVLVRRRRYLADGFPMETATSYVPWSLAHGTQMTEPNTGPGGIYARIEEAGYRLERFAEEVTARMPSPEEVKALRLMPGVPVIGVVRTAYDSNGQPVEVCDTVMAADRYVLTYELPAR